MPIFFDLDDTLIDHSAANHLAGLAVYETYQTQINCDQTQFVTAWNGSHQQRFQRYLEGQISLLELRRARARDVLGRNISNRQADEVVSVYARAYRDHWKLFPDVWPCLDRLYSQRLGIITNADRSQQIDKLVTAGIKDYFYVIVCYDKTGLAKPDPRMFARACRLIGCQPKEAVHIGDSLKDDVQGSRQAGIRGIWLNRKEPKAVTGIEVIRSLEELVI